MKWRGRGPFQLIHFVTSACNAECSHCFYKDNLNRKNDLHIDEIIRITKTLPGLRLLILTGGEPFIREDLPAIFKAYCSNTDVREVTIPTNGFLTEKIVRDCREMLQSCNGLRFNIAVSLDGPREIHNRIRGVPDGYERAVKTILHLKKIQYELRKLKISVTSTLMPETQDGMIDFFEVVKRELNPDYHTMNLFRSLPKKPGFPGLKTDILKELLELENAGTKKKGLRSLPRGFIHRLRLNLLWDTVTESKYRIPCRSGNLSAVLSENGTVYPCDLINEPIGQLRDFNFDFGELWRSEVRKEVRDQIIRDRCFCTFECQYRVAVVSNPLYMLKNLLTLRINSVRIQKQKKSISGGKQ